MIVNFIVYDDFGTIVRSGRTAQEYVLHQAGAGEHVLEVENPVDDTKFAVDVLKGTLYSREIKDPPKTAVMRRIEEYPPIGDQLDTVWKALEKLHIDGTKLPSETVRMLNAVMAVKDKYPKN